MNLGDKNKHGLATSVKYVDQYSTYTLICWSIPRYRDTTPLQRAESVAKQTNTDRGGINNISVNKIGALVVLLNVHKLE